MPIVNNTVLYTYAFARRVDLMLGVLTHIQIINKLGERTLLALMGMFMAEVVMMVSTVYISLNSSCIN